MNDNTQAERKKGICSGLTSLIASLMSLCTFFLYGSWHWDLVRIRRAGTTPPSWLTWGVVDGMKLASVILAVVALIFAGMALRRNRWVLGVVALILAILCAMTIPVIT